jgi:hypothetical protein
MINRALMELNGALSASGQHLQIGIFGGSAMAMALHVRATTQDLDVWTDDPALLRDRAAVVAIKLRLPKQWINDEGVRFLPRISTRFDTWRIESNLTILMAKPQVLLAMKMDAARVKDIGDIRFLFRHLKLESFDQAHALFNAFYGRKIDARSELLIRAAVNDSG